MVTYKSWRVQEKRKSKEAVDRMCDTKSNKGVNSEMTRDRVEWKDKTYLRRSKFYRFIQRQADYE